MNFNYSSESLIIFKFNSSNWSLETNDGALSINDNAEVLSAFAWAFRQWKNLPLMAGKI